jgi:hypothetical protein
MARNTLFCYMAWMWSKIDVMGTNKIFTSVKLDVRETLRQMKENTWLSTSFALYIERESSQ